MQNEIAGTKHMINMTDCAALSITGVKEVLNFDDTMVTMVTSCGVLTVEGEGIRISSLDPVKGTTEIVGRVSELFYTKAKEKGNGFFRRGK